MNYYANEERPVSIPTPDKKVGGGGIKPRPVEGKLWPTGLPKKDK